MSAWLSQKTSDANIRHATLALAGQSLMADLSGALYWPAQSTLIVADLHLEKGSSYARFRHHLPPYDTAATLQQLAQLIALYDPRRVIALGDSVHDRSAWDRLDDDAIAQLRHLVDQVEEWVWISGNHDPDPPKNLPGRAADELLIDTLLFRHEPGGAVHDNHLEVAGHLHPAARVVGKGASTRRPAFVGDGKRLVLPAFGAYAGGLCLSAPPFKQLFAPPLLRAWVCGRTRVFSVPGKRIAGWR